MIEKEVNIQVLDQIAVKAVVKELRNSLETNNKDLYVFDLYDEDGVCLASDRYELAEDAPFELTEEEIEELQNPRVEDEQVPD